MSSIKYIVASSRRGIEKSMNAGALENMVVVLNIIDWIIAKEPAPTPQIGEPVFFERRRPSQSVMPMAGNLKDIYDHIRMLDAPSYPAAFLEYGEFRLEFTHAEYGDGQVSATISIRMPEQSKD